MTGFVGLLVPAGGLRTVDTDGALRAVLADVAVAEVFTGTSMLDLALPVLLLTLSALLLDSATPWRSVLLPADLADVTDVTDAVLLVGSTPVTAPSELVRPALLLMVATLSQVPILLALFTACALPVELLAAVSSSAASLEAALRDCAVVLLLFASLTTLNPLAVTDVVLTP